MAANLGAMRRVLAWALMGALAVVLVILAVPFLQWAANSTLWMVEDPRFALLWLISLLFALSPFIAVWLIFRSGKLTR